MLSLTYEIRRSGLPGSNCDHDIYNVIDALAEQPVDLPLARLRRTWRLRRYLVPAASLRRLPPYRGHRQVRRRTAMGHGKSAKSGGLVFGICNGFEILCESGHAFPARLMRNAGAQALHLQAGPFPHRDNRFPLHPWHRARPRPADAHRPHGRQRILRPRDARNVEGAGSHRSSAMPRHRARSPLRPIPMAHWTTLQACSAKAGTSSA